MKLGRRARPAAHRARWSSPCCALLGDELHRRQHATAAADVGEPATTERPAATAAATGRPRRESDRLDDGGFGDLEDVCQDGDAVGLARQGRDRHRDQRRHRHRQGLDDPARPQRRRCTTPPWRSPKWCNEHGGILGRKLVLTDLDAKLFEYPAAVTKGCQDGLRPGRRRRGVRRRRQRRPGEVRPPQHRRLRGERRGPERRAAGAAGARTRYDRGPGRPVPRS